MTPTSGTHQGRRVPVGPAMLFFIAMAAVPLLQSDFWTLIATETVILGLFAMSFNLLYGYMGQISFGHAAYFGTSAYAMAMVQQYFLAHGDFGYGKFLLALAASIPAAAISAGIVGLFVVRRTGIYFSILTMAFGELMYFLVFSSYKLTGGDNGIQGLLPPGILRGATAYHYFTLAVTATATLIMWWILRSPFGFTLRAVRDNARRAQFLGINVTLCMWMNFVLAGAFAGLAGGLWAPFTRSVAPPLLNWQESGIPVFMTLIGGAYTFAGPLIGALIYTVLHAWVTGFTVYWPLTIGLIMILIVYFAPGGILSMVPKWLHWLRHRKPSSAPHLPGEGL